MKLIFICCLAVFAPLSILAQNGFTSVKGIDKLETDGQKIVMDYSTNTGSVNGKEASIIDASCDPKQYQTVVIYRLSDGIYRLVFLFDAKGKFVNFSNSRINQKS